MSERMKVLIGYDGSSYADAALYDLRRAGLPHEGDALVMSVGDVLFTPRRLLTSMPHVPVADIMITDVITVPHRATVLEACEMFVKHKFFALPIVDDEGRMRGVIDIRFFTEETIDLAER